jgi:hypothetical protein
VSISRLAKQLCLNDGLSSGFSYAGRSIGPLGLFPVGASPNADGLTGERWTREKKQHAHVVHCVSDANR